MNSACLIAACASSSRNTNPDKYVTYTTFNYEWLYKVKFRMYIHFNPINVVRPIEDGYFGSIYAPIKTTFIDTVIVEPKTVAQEYGFFISSEKAKPNIDKYIEANIERFTGSSLWDIYKTETINKYIEDIKKKYNVIVDESSLDYSIQYIWEVQSC